MNVDVNLLFFAKAREIVGKNSAKINVSSVISYENLLKIIIEEFSLLDIKSNIILAINDEYCGANDILNLKERDEIAIIPPLSGG